MLWNKWFSSIMVNTVCSVAHVKGHDCESIHACITSHSLSLSLLGWFSFISSSSDGVIAKACPNWYHLWGIWVARLVVNSLYVNSSSSIILHTFQWIENCHNLPLVLDTPPGRVEYPTWSVSQWWVRDSPGSGGLSLCSFSYTPLSLELICCPAQWFVWLRWQYSSLEATDGMLILTLQSGWT